jgi:hypothetical protein
MFELITPLRQVYTPMAFNQEPIASDLIASGSDCLGSANGVFVDKGLWFRNKKAMIVFENLHETLQAYVRIPTSYTHKTLPLNDLIFTLAPSSGAVHVLGFSYNFNHSGEITINGSAITVNDLVKINISHDSTDPSVKVAVYYV